MIARDFVCPVDGTFDDIVSSSARSASCPKCAALCPMTMSAPAVVIARTSAGRSGGGPRRSLADIGRERVANANAKQKPAPTEDSKRETHQKAQANLAHDLVKYGNGRVSEKKAAAVAESVARTAINRANDPKA